ncbi:FolC bifunctional protein [Xylariomycetidae sp. FL0641]|nr:FolC bifunctional protein [Xylariomycetidae sp. FL0641]
MASRTYETALEHLAQLQSNKAITSLFAPTPVTAPGSQPPQDLNALAIPEMLAWLQRAGLDRDTVLAPSPLRCIHVAGTKGKGSVCAYLTSMLQRTPGAGRVGTYTSPHLVTVRERIQIDGEPLSQAQFTRYFFEVWDTLSSAARAEAQKQQQPVSDADLDGPATKPFFFRFLTLVALHTFLREGVRTAVVECGIGGEHDSTNVLPAASVTAAVVAPLGLDHVAMLGDTVEQIAWHKAGVCKPGRRCFTRRLPHDHEAATMRVLRARAAEKGAAALVEIADEEVERWGGVACAALGGRFQIYNQALAVAAAKEHMRVLLQGKPDDDAGGQTPGVLEEIPDTFVEGLRHARLRGRCETRAEGGGRLTWLIDGAHTAESMQEVARWFAEKARARPAARRLLLFNQQDRDATALLRGLLAALETHASPGPLFAEAVFPTNELLGAAASGLPPRDLTVQEAAAKAMAAFDPETTTVVVDCVGDAVDKVRASAAAEDGRETLVLATGSLYLVGSLLRTLEPDAEI